MWNTRTAWTISPAPVLEIGDETAPEYQFTYVAGAARLSDGSIAMIDAGTNELRLFDQHGRHAKTAAKQGGGPGEIKAVNGLFVLPGDTLVVNDGRVTHSYFTADGRYLRSVSLQSPPGGPPAQTLGFFGDGTFLADQDAPTPRQPGAAIAADSATAIRFGADGSPVKILNRFPSRSRATFGPVGWIAPSGNRYYTAWSETPDIAVRSVDGTILQVIRKPWTAARVSPDDIERFKARERATTRTVAGQPLPANVIRRRDSALATMRFADTFALFVGGWTDREGNLWVRHYEMQHLLRDAVDAPTTHPNHYSVFDTSGRWLGDIEVPVNLQLLDVSDTHVVGTSKTDDGVEHIRVHQLIKPKP